MRKNISRIKKDIVNRELKLCYQQRQHSIYLIESMRRLLAANDRKIKNEQSASIDTNSVKKRENTDGFSATNSKNPNALSFNDVNESAVGSDKGSQEYDIYMDGRTDNYLLQKMLKSKLTVEKIDKYLSKLRFWAENDTSN